MADEKLTELVEETSPAGTDLVYVVTDPDGTPTSKKVKIENLPGGGSGGSEISSTDGVSTARVTTATPGPSEFPYYPTAEIAVDGPSGGFVAVQSHPDAGDFGTSSVVIDVGAVAMEAFWDNGLRLGFFGTEPVTRPQIDGSTATVADLCAALHALGVIEDTSL